MVTAHVHVLQSPLLQHVPHGFSTRSGGVSRGMFDSLNFGNPSDLPSEARDPVSNIHANQQRLLHAIGQTDSPEWVNLHQVHGDQCHVVRRGEASHRAGTDASGQPLSTKADALVTDDPGRVLSIRIADCAPILLAAADGSVVGAVHAGWRGVALRVAVEAVAALRRLAPGRADRPLAAIGPCIGPAAFQVGHEVVAALAQSHPDLPPHLWSRPDPAAPDRSLVDLPALLRHQLLAAGCLVCTACCLCTVSRPELFFSHRRDQGRTGRLTAVIRARQAT